MRPPVVDNRIVNGIACIRRDVVCFLRSGKRFVKSGMSNSLAKFGSRMIFNSPAKLALRN